MNHSNFIVFFLTSILFLASCKKDETDTTHLDKLLDEAIQNVSNGIGKSAFQLPDENDFSKIPQDPLNPLTTEKVTLGKLLYHETGLGLDPKNEIGKQTYSCASCHFASAGFQAGRFQGIGEGGIGMGINDEGRVKGVLYSEMQVDVQPIRTPTTLNSAYQMNMLWNGQFGATGVNLGTESKWTAGTPKEINELGFEGVESQAIAGAGVHRLKADINFLTDAGYIPLFDAAFPNISENERYTLTTLGLAIAAYERTLMANQAPFQKWLKGKNNALTDKEKLGAILFFEDAKCVSCHNGPALNEMEFYALGMKDLYDSPEEIFNANANSVENKGQGGFTGKQEDMYKFKVPQLYNLKDSPFFEHGSSFRSIHEILVYKNNAITENPTVPTSQLSSEFIPLQLSQEELDNLTLFFGKRII